MGHSVGCNIYFLIKYIAMREMEYMRLKVHATYLYIVYTCI